MSTAPTSRHPQVTLGLDSFGEVTSAEGGGLSSNSATIRGIVEQGVLADHVGVDHFAIGEHHIEAMPVSTPDVVLAAIAARTQHIRLGSGVTVLSSDDPVRVHQRYATLDAVSGGRAELILGRGSSVESFPLFGYDLTDYERLFDEKLELFAQLRAQTPVTWRGSARPPLDDARLFPRSDDALPTWVGVGGTPASVIRAARHGMHLMMAIIGGRPERFAPLSALFQDANARLGHAPGRIGVHSPGHVAATDAQAAAEYWPFYRDFLPEARRARGIPDPTPASFEREIGPGGSLYVGSPETVADKIVTTMRTLQADRFDLKYGVHRMPEVRLRDAIELFGREVVPRVRARMT